MQEASMSMCESDNGESCYEPIAPMLVPVNRVITERDKAIGLLNEIISTLSLPRNQSELISKLNEQILPSWKRRWKEISGNGGTS